MHQAPEHVLEHCPAQSRDPRQTTSIVTRTREQNPSTFPAIQLPNRPTQWGTSARHGQELDPGRTTGRRTTLPNTPSAVLRDARLIWPGTGHSACPSLNTSYKKAHHTMLPELPKTGPENILQHCQRHRGVPKCQTRLGQELRYTPGPEHILPHYQRLRHRGAP